MKVYHYKADTKEFIGAGEARQDPKDKSRFLIPANATIEEPPSVSKNEVAIFNDGWVVKKDFRGTIYYDTKAIEEKQIVNIGEEVPAKDTLLKPETLFKPVWKNNKWEESADFYDGFIVESVEDIERIYLDSLMKYLPALIEASSIPKELKDEYEAKKLEKEDKVKEK
jgi:hypothetical protein